MTKRASIARFNEIRPEAIVRCRSAEDVMQTLPLAHRTGAGMAIRSGGQPFTGRSSTEEILVDVGPAGLESRFSGLCRPASCSSP
jgi:FAD/FMN-containing dehydrogenase